MTPLPESTLASVYILHEKKGDPLAQANVALAHALIVLPCLS